MSPSRTIQEPVSLAAVDAEALIERLRIASDEALAALGREDYPALRSLSRQRDELIRRATPLLDRARAEIALAPDAATLTRRLEVALLEASAASDRLIRAVGDHRRLVAAAIEEIPKPEVRGYGWRSSRALRVDVVR